MKRTLISLAATVFTLLVLSGANSASAQGTCNNTSESAKKEDTDCWLEKVKSGEKNLSGAYLAFGELSGADLQGVDLSGAALFGADLSGANLSGSNLSRANLGAANLKGANLSRVNLSAADLTTADLSDSDLKEANLDGAVVTSAYLLLFGRTSTEGVDFSGWKSRSMIAASANTARRIL